MRYKRTYKRDDMSLVNCTAVTSFWQPIGVLVTFSYSPNARISLHLKPRNEDRLFFFAIQIPSNIDKVVLALYSGRNRSIFHIDVCSTLNGVASGFHNMPIPLIISRWARVTVTRLLFIYRYTRPLSAHRFDIPRSNTTWIYIYTVPPLYVWKCYIRARSTKDYTRPSH